jgi:hypothetical protein
MDFPLIMIDNHGNISSWRGNRRAGGGSLSPGHGESEKDFCPDQGPERAVRYMYNGEVFQSIYYGDSRLITRLEYLPYLTFSGTGLLILLAFIGFNNIKQSEQRFIWVGMAKETAHQLGTPISSLLGWLELMKAGDMAPDKISRLAQDMENDVRRLEKIAARFSKIGSTANLEKQDIHQVLREVAAYFRKRLPQAGARSGWWRIMATCLWCCSTASCSNGPSRI